MSLMARPSAPISSVDVTGIRSERSPSPIRRAVVAMERIGLLMRRDTFPLIMAMPTAIRSPITQMMIWT